MPERGLERPSRGVRAPAVVLGNTDMIRPLTMAGIECAVVSRPDRPAAHTRRAREVIEWADNWGNPEQLLENVLGYGHHHPEPLPLFYQHDGDLAFVSHYRDRLRECFRFVVGDAELVDQLMDKTLFCELAERRGLPVPPSAVLRPLPVNEPPDLPFDYPLVVKPLTRRDVIWKPLAGDSKALLIESRAQLAELWPLLAEHNLDFLAQQLVPGGEERIESYHVYVDERGDVAGEFTGRKVRTLPRDYGHTTALEITDAGDVREVGRECMAKLGLRGVAKLDFKRAPSGELLLLEVNARFNLWHHAGAVAGVNLPAIVYADLLGLPRPATGPVRAGVRWSVPWDDLAAARQAGVPLSRWAMWQARCETRYVLALDDPMPFLRGLVWPKVRRRVRSRA